MPKPNSLSLYALLLAVTLGACQDSTTEPAEPLNMEEAEALYFGMSVMLADTTPEIISMTPDGGVFACPLGGQAAVTLETSEETAGDTSSLITNTTVNPERCVLSSEGYEFTLDGNPHVQLALTIAIVTSTFEFMIDGSMTGGLDWELDNRSGTCALDLVFDAELDFSGTEPTPTNGTFVGTMCGHEVEFDANNVGMPAGVG